MNTEEKNNVQFIRENGEIKYVVLDYPTYQDLITDSEDIADIKEAEAILAAVESGEMETYPDEVVSALLDGENPYRVWREFRGVSRKELADKLSISLPYLSQLETGKRDPSFSLIKKMSSVLKIDIDMFLFGQNDEDEE
jgi:DNA-binding XRE family transcriptional regulator